LRAFELLEIQDELTTDTTSYLPVNNFSHLDGIRIKFNQVSFKYQSSEQENIERVSFSVAPGQQIALVGPSGAGKSTMADLIIGLLQPSSGNISLNGETPKQFLVNNPGVVSYVPQKPGLVSGSILDNIALGIKVEDIDDGRVQEVLRQAHLLNVVEALPNGVDSDLGKHLDGLSGGQLQRIGLARALYSEPKLLILDEATSALDANSENEINAVLQEMRGRVTVVIIAHRFNLLQNSDQIFLIEEGRISDSGTYEHLLATSRVFQELAGLEPESL
jgi:ATP-binding cassette subfamily C protein